MKTINSDMDNVDIRKELHEFIDEADEKLVKAILLTEDNMDDFEISDEHKRILDERLKAYHENPSDVFTWEELKAKIEKLQTIHQISVKHSSNPK